MIVARDGDGCVWCSRPFDRFVRPTREHVVPRADDGPGVGREQDVEAFVGAQGNGQGQAACVIPARGASGRDRAHLAGA